MRRKPDAAIVFERTCGVHCCPNCACGVYHAAVLAGWFPQRGYGHLFLCDQQRIGDYVSDGALRQKVSILSADFGETAKHGACLAAGREITRTGSNRDLSSGIVPAVSARSANIVCHSKSAPAIHEPVGDRKSTRLNSSHVKISYA